MVKENYQKAFRNSLYDLRMRNHVAIICLSEEGLMDSLSIQYQTDYLFQYFLFQPYRFGE
ncbi:MAG: hypothetical protein BGO34_12565 [Bacteroidia bacterium 44-10]|nr:MAG: hypothetical protein BGO34_12565 [Bacteroidia bacterium 44-10]